MRKVVTLALAVMMVLAVLVGCNSNSSSNTTPPVTQDDKVAIFIGALNHPTHRIAQMSFITKAQEMGYDAQISGLDEGSQQELIAKWESAITNGVTGAMLWTGDDQCYEMMRNMSDQCVFIVPHFAHDYFETKSFISRNISCLPTAYGAAAAEFIVEQLTAKGITSGSIGITQAGANVTENAANDAFRKKIKELNAPFTVADTIFEGADPAEAINKVAGVISGNPDIVAGFSTTGGGALAWSTAKSSAGKDHLIVVATDYTEINLDCVKDGKISALICQPLYEEAQMSMETLDAIFKGQSFSGSAEDWFVELEGPLAYLNGTGANDPSSYDHVIDKVLAFSFD